MTLTNIPPKSTRSTKYPWHKLTEQTPVVITKGNKNRTSILNSAKTYFERRGFSVKVVGRVVANTQDLTVHVTFLQSA